MNAVIYMLTCRTTEKQYIGQSARGLDRRWKQHVVEARKSRRSSRLYSAMRKYGTGTFDRQIVEYTSPDELDAAESFWIEWYRTVEDGLNLKPGGNTPGYALETRAKMSARAKEPHRLARLKGLNRGRKASAETRAKMSAAQKGKHGIRHSRETKEKIRLKAIGRNVSQVARANMAKAQRGRKHSPATIERMIQSSNPLRLAHDGLSLTIAEWAVRLGMREHTLRRRFQLGQSASEALSCGTTEPIRIEHAGKSLTISEWAELLKWPRRVLEDRKRRGWSIERMLSQPLVRK